MFSRIIAISVKELKLLLRDGAALGVLFLLPIVFVSIMTYAGVGRQGVQTVSILVGNEDQGPASLHSGAGTSVVSTVSSRF